MAFFAGCVDPDPQRRAAFLATATATAATFTRHPPRTWRAGHAAALFAAPLHAPDRHHRLATSDVWQCGELFDDAGPSSRLLADAVARGGAHGAHGLNGVYLALVIDHDGAATLATDWFGQIPLYVWSNREVFVFASQPELVTRHPAYHGERSVSGLVGILMYGRMANGQTLWTGVTQPDIGHVVHWRPGTPAREQTATPIPAVTADSARSFEEACADAERALERAVRIRTSDQSVSLLLSGGLDSRLIAAQLADPSTTRAVVFGDPADNEPRCARRVARALRMPLTVVPTDFRGYAEGARRTVASEGLCSAARDFSWMASRAVLARHDAPVLSGLHGDAIMGASALSRFRDLQTQAFSPRAYYARNEFRKGLTLDEIRTALDHPSIEAVVQEILDESQRRFDRLPGEPFQQAILWSLGSSDRHIVGASAWRLADAAWPRTPYYDVALVTSVLQCPLPFLASRRLQETILRTRFPRLARLPLDANALHNPPLVPSWYWRARSRLERIRRRIMPITPERRTYYRTHDLNNAGWRAVREAAEPGRQAATAFVSARALADLVPSPSATFQLHDGILDAGRHKIALMLMLLAQHRTPDAAS
jgi:hypothetical protein